MREAETKPAAGKFFPMAVCGGGLDFAESVLQPRGARLHL